ncbi:RHS repeat-associated core domain-containing protein [Sorangium sp. So ce1024]|uniref:RHS repeat-associated core domain-containing protein n=1 Tax=unclassified Sorangium TaxID=2621164 RepID=UPI003F52877B
MAVLLCLLRYYDPRIGRYLSPDPLGVYGGLNVFAYADNDPSTHVDPDGLLPMAVTSTRAPRRTRRAGSPRRTPGGATTGGYGTGSRYGATTGTKTHRARRTTPRTG